MPKTLPPGTVDLGHGTFTANVAPDVFDQRDLVYRPKLQPLPPTADGRPQDRYVLTQTGNSCTGHAMAAMINAVLATQNTNTHVSPYMLYWLARRYDEFPGEADEGSSLRGALKGWYYHGVLPDTDWPTLDPATVPDIDGDSQLADLAMHFPLGAFYRVDSARIDDLQSAVTELSAIVASAAVHDGWIKPVEWTRDGQTMCVIERSDSAQQIGGHAFCIVGYNEVGFLIQNSWGTEWGHNGFATLPYDDWIESAYDAWVARPGVRSILSQRSRTRLATITGGGVADAPGPDLAKLAGHVINLGNNGRLSTGGRFVSTPAQIDRVFTQMQQQHEAWSSANGHGPSAPRRVMIYAHGGLNSESTGLAIADQQRQWWLNNKVYPITFAWQTGPVETLLDQFTDMLTRRVPAGGLGFNLVEQFDRLAEKFARTNARWMWDEMKENARLASEPIPADRRPMWPFTPAAAPALADLPGASLSVSRLAAYVKSSPDPVEIHLVGHSAGSIFLAEMMARLVEADLTVTSLSFLAPAVRTDQFIRQVLPHLRSGKIAHFASFGLSAARELDDVCGAGKITVYQKSLLYLVARALEHSADDVEVPLVGMAHFLDTPVSATTLEKAMTEVGGDLVWAPSDVSPTRRSDSTSHGGFDNDGPTMTSVMLRVLDRATITAENTYAQHAAPLSAAGVAAAVATQRTEEPVTIEARDAGAVPVTISGPRQLRSVPDDTRVERIAKVSRIAAALQDGQWQKDSA